MQMAQYFIALVRIQHPHLSRAFGGEEITRLCLSMLMQMAARSVAFWAVSAGAVAARPARSRDVRSGEVLRWRERYSEKCSLDARRAGAFRADQLEPGDPGNIPAGASARGGTSEYNDYV